MKITHWAIIFVIIIIPFSIICRSTINKKTLVLQDQTRINNILDNATYDAVNQIVEVSEELDYGKNIPITNGVAMAAIDRFFQSMAVNFNLPSRIDVSKDYFGQYIPAILIIGYDGLYVYSYDRTPTGYQYVLKPKIPYTYTDKTSGLIVNFTLDNDVTVYFPDRKVQIKGHVGTLNHDEELALNANMEEYFASNELLRLKYIFETLPYLTDNISYIFKKIDNNSIAPELFYMSNVEQDYIYDDNGNVIQEASEFHKIRRQTIINLIIATLQEEVNEHNTYANIIGVKYNFNIPDIDREQWNNSINDISVLAFFQGMPIGTDSYYNNYSLGGAKIVEAQYIYATNDGKYHKQKCSMIPKDSITGEIIYDTSEPSYVTDIFINAKHAHSAGYWACEFCR